MTFDTSLFASKLSRYRAQFQLDVDDFVRLTGIKSDRVCALEAGEVKPTGDEVLILADVFKCDYRFFISSERVAPFEETEELFRRHGDALTREDRWAIQEFLHLCECEAFLLDVLGRHPPVAPFVYVPKDRFFKRDGANAAKALRAHLGLETRQDITDVFDLLRRLGLRVFRRSLQNSEVSGLFVRHPVAGLCILVNYSEDVYRQRFTAAHEACHAFLDTDQGFVVSFESGSSKWSRDDLVEIRANAFAGQLLLPDDLVSELPKVTWTLDNVTTFANKLRVNPVTLMFRLSDLKLIDKATITNLRRSVKIPIESKVDPEIGTGLTTLQAERKLRLLRLGLSAHYVGLCFDALQEGHVSKGRVAEMMLCDERELQGVAALFGRVLS